MKMGGVGSGLFACSDSAEEKLAVLNVVLRIVRDTKDDSQDEW